MQSYKNVCNWVFINPKIADFATLLLTRIIRLGDDLGLADVA
jgi:hypothetical protein